MERTLKIRMLGQQPYEPMLEAMQSFTAERTADSDDEIWFLEHPPVFTQGQSGKAEHLLAPGDIPVVQVDRGGQVTYHGPGQQVIYLLLDLKRLGMGVRELVTLIEQTVAEVLESYAINAYPKSDAPGVYVSDTLSAEAKIASLGLRVRRGCTFHGVALNVAMDLTPFDRINPCGYAGLAMTQISDLCRQQGQNPPSLAEVGQRLQQVLVRRLGYTHTSTTEQLG
ncbi:lipoyl(octanoyl) transferase LipB [Motiliproteus sp.]|uniref:lipoyl(octanoyl) transferase LipB n=1 Tax=Motiliproteus sp. TaxID=1898955 RepID=UPI003BAAB41C